MFRFKIKIMKDNLQNYLENECKAQKMAKNFLNKEVIIPNFINSLSISSVRQIRKLQKRKTIK